MVLTVNSHRRSIPPYRHKAEFAVGIADVVVSRNLLIIKEIYTYNPDPAKYIAYNQSGMSALPEYEVTRLLNTDTVALRNVRCSGTCRHRSVEECVSTTHLVFPYRGVYLRHVGGDQAVADANQVLFFNANEGYQISHPMAGGDSSLSLALSAHVLRELAPASLLNGLEAIGFRRQHQRIDPRAQALVAVLRHSLDNGTIEPLEAESLVLTLVCRSLGPRTSHEPGASRSGRRLANRVKVLLASDLSRRWSLAEIAREIGPARRVYLTQVSSNKDRRHPALPLSPPVASRARLGPDCSIRRFVRLGRRSRVFEPQPFCCRFSAGLWAVADGLQAIRPALLENH